MFVHTIEDKRFLLSEIYDYALYSILGSKIIFVSIIMLINISIRVLAYV